MHILHFTNANTFILSCSNIFSYTVYYWYNQKKMDQTLHLFPTVALEVCNSLEIFDYTASDDSLTCWKRWKSAGKVFFLARSPEAPSTIMDKQPDSEDSSRSLKLDRGELKLFRPDNGEDSDDPPDMMNCIVFFFCQIKTYKGWEGTINHTFCMIN